MRLFNAGARRVVPDARRSIPDDVPIESKMVTRAIASAQTPGRGAQLRDPQERPQVRRRDEPAARGHLRRAPPGPRGRGPARAGAALHRRRRRAPTSTPRPPRASPRTGTSTQLWTALRTLYPVAITHRRGRRAEAGGRHGDHAATCSGAELASDAQDAYDEREEALGDGRRCASWSAGSCSRCSTASGASTSTRWTTSRRASACARWPSATRWSSTSARASRCSRR